MRALTGGVLTCRYEINRWLNPEYSVAPQPGPMLDPYRLRERALALAPGSRINSMPLYVAPGDAYVVSPQSPDLGFSALIINPYTGEEIHRVRETGLWPPSRHTFLALAGALHNRLAMGALGRWLVGSAALAFALDCFVGLYLALTPPAQPDPSSAAPALQASSRLRSAGLARSPGRRAVERGHEPARRRLCARHEEPYPARSVFQSASETARATAGAGARLAGGPRHRPEAHGRAGQNVGLHRRCTRGGWPTFPKKAQFAYTVYTDREIIRRGTFTAVYFDGVTGAQTLATTPRGEGPGSAFTLWLMALHTGEAAWRPMRLVALGMGALLAFLSVSGVLVWWTSRSGPNPVRLRRAERQRLSPARKRRG